MNGAAPTPPSNPLDAKPILDYASPRSHGKLRLPSQSIIEWHWADASRERDLVVTEKLRGRAGAMVALLFALFTLFLLGVMLREFVRSFSNGWTQADLGQIAVVSLVPVLWLTEATTMVLVIRNTWRQTILETVDGELHLAFVTWVGLSARRYCWLPGTVSDVRVVPLDTELGTGELQIFPEGHKTVQLFTDHSEDGLQMIAASLRKELHLP